jgi:hypothetical protein
MLLTATPTSWTITSISGSTLKRITVSEDASCYVYAPTIDSSWAKLANPGEVFAITNVSPNLLANDEGAQFELNMNNKTGEFSVFSKRLQKFLGVSSSTDAEMTTAVSFRSGDGKLNEWEFILAAPPQVNWTIPSWMVRNKMSNIPNLADGVYRITNGQTKTCLALASHDGDPGTKGVEVTGNLKEVSGPGNKYECYLGCILIYD